MMKSLLNLKAVPRYVEGLDISNIQGDMAVGAIVSYVDGLPNRQGYRNYRIINLACQMECTSLELLQLSVFTPCPFRK